MNSAKGRFSVVFIGRHNAGKSTVAGHLIAACGGITAPSMQKIEAEALEKGKESCKYAWILDTLPDERDLDMTMKVSFANFETPKYAFTVIDAPGHGDYVNDLIAGISQADLAVLVVDSSRDDCIQELGQRGGQTREHIELASVLGVQKIIIVCNKMDCEANVSAPTRRVSYSEKRFKFIQKVVQAHLRDVGYHDELVPFLPICGLTGENVVSSGANMPWYEGKTLLGEFTKTLLPLRQPNKSLRIPIYDVVTIGGESAACIGRIATGVMRPGSQVTFAPSGGLAAFNVLSVHQRHKAISAVYDDDNDAQQLEGLTEAGPGETICFCVETKGVKFDIQRGAVASHPGDGSAKGISTFESKLTITNIPERMRVGYTAMVHCHTAAVECTVSNIMRKMDRVTGIVIKENPEYVETGDSCIVSVECASPFCVEVFGRFPSLGRLVFRDIGQSSKTVAVGIVTSVDQHTA